jgi:hypothetical protein
MRGVLRNLSINVMFNLLISISIIVLSLLILNKFVQPEVVKASTNTIRVLEVRYFPHGQSDVIYHPDTLSTNLQTLLSNSSKFHGYSNPSATSSVDVEIVGVYNREGARPNPNGTWYSTYEAILAEDDLCDVINSQDIDQLWLWVDPRTGYDPGPGVEYAISSNYFENGSEFATVANPAFCGGERGFLFMGFDTTRTADYALHSFGHMLEGVLGNLQTTDLFWYRFSGNTAAGFPLAERCGNVHFPPNGTVDYDYANTTYVNTACEDWKPDGTGTQTSYNCTKWGCNQSGFLQWWLQNLPNTGNTLSYQGKTLPSWWDFTYNLDQNIYNYSQDTNYHMNRAFTDLYDCGVSTVTSQSASQLNLTAAGCGSSDKLIAVTASYRAVLNQNTQRISALTYNGTPMIKGCDSHSNEYTTEIWYYTAPSSTGGTISATWSLGAAQDIVLGSKTFSDVKLVNPVAGTACSSDNGTWGTNPIGKNPEVSISSSSTQTIFGTATTYTGSSNIVSVDHGTQKWYTKTTNIISSAVTEAGSTNAKLEWTGTSNWPWSTAAISFRTSADNSAPSVPTYIAPANLAVSQQLNLTLSWNASTDPENQAITYDVYFGTTEPGMTVVSADQSGTTYNVANLTQGVNYFWKVEARDSMGATSTGATWSFSAYSQIAVPNNSAKNRTVLSSGITGSAGSITNGFKFSEFTAATTQPSVQLNTTSSFLTVDLGSKKTITSIKLQADSNDQYIIEVSANNSTWTSYGTVPTIAGSGFQTRTITFTKNNVRYVRVKALSGDGNYYVSEIEVYP